MKVHRLNQNQTTRSDVIKEIGAGILIFILVMACAWMFLAALPDPAHGHDLWKPHHHFVGVAPDPVPAPSQKVVPAEKLPTEKKQHRDPEKLDAIDVLGNIAWALTFLL